jgi:hypothetical protein
MTDDLVKRLRVFAELDPDLTEALDRVEELEAALRLGVDMREKQKAYFKSYFQDLLLDCQKAERDFDVSARAALGEKKEC